MTEKLISVDGEEVVVREDTAKAVRGVNWALLSIAGFVLLTGGLFIIFAVTAWSDGEVTAPVQQEREALR